MTSSANPPVGTDWTRLLADPDLATHLGELLQIYREASPSERNQALRKAMLQIKGAKASAETAKVETDVAPVPIEPVPPFEPGLFAGVRGDDRRNHPRMKCFVAVELRPENSAGAIWGNLSNISIGGCLVETTTPVSSQSRLELGLWVANGKIWVKGIVLNGMVTRSNPCFGVRVRFQDVEPAERETLKQFLKYVESTTRGYEASYGYLANLKR
jgi:hypothetical protein